MSFRPVLVAAHRWAGLASSAVLSVTGVSGAFLIWPGTFLAKVGGRLHENIALGRIGAWIVLAATASAVFLECTGLILWWRRRSLGIAFRGGWRRLAIDVHYSAGFIGLVAMLMLASTGLLLTFVTPRNSPALRSVLMEWHSARTFPLGVQLLYVACTCGFLVQGVSGVWMWWTGRARAGRRPKN